MCRRACATSFDKSMARSSLHTSKAQRLHPCSPKPSMYSNKQVKSCRFSGLPESTDTCTNRTHVPEFAAPLLKKDKTTTFSFPKEEPYSQHDSGQAIASPLTKLKADLRCSVRVASERRERIMKRALQAQDSSSKGLKGQLVPPCN